MELLSYFIIIHTRRGEIIGQTLGWRTGRGRHMKVITVATNNKSSNHEIRQDIKGEIMFKIKQENIEMRTQAAVTGMNSTLDKTLPNETDDKKRNKTGNKPWELKIMSSHLTQNHKKKTKKTNLEHEII